MAFYSNHHPEDIDACRFGEDPYQPTEADWEEYAAYLDSLPGPSFPEPETQDTRDYDAWIEAQAAELSIPDEAA
jgi:hypothetical protein